MWYIWLSAAGRRTRERRGAQKNKKKKKWPDVGHGLQAAGVLREGVDSVAGGGAIGSVGGLGRRRAGGDSRPPVAGKSRLHRANIGGAPQVSTQRRSLGQQVGVCNNEGGRSPDAGLKAGGQ